MNPTGYSSDSAVQYDTARSGGSKRDGEGMEVLPLHPKSLVALQELQNEVGALLEFRDLVIETFPNLRNKMSCVAGVAPPSSSIPLPATARRDWEAGTRVRRKLLRENDLLEGSLSRSRSNSHSKLGSGGVQDSGFSTDATSTSSKDSSTPSAAGGNAGSSSASGQIPAYDELWSLLDVIHRKGTRIRDEAKQLQAQAAWNDSDDESKPFRQHLLSAAPRDLVILRQERDNLLDRVTDMEASNLVGKVKTNALTAQVESLVAAKNDLQKELDNALSEKTELNTRLERLLNESGRSSRNVLVNGSFRPLSPHHRTSSMSDRSLDRSVGEQQLVLGRLDGVLGSPYKSQRLRAPDPHKITAILQEKNHVELQRHLLTATAENQTLTVRLNECARSRRLLQERLEKTREENEDLRFQLEERNIELEGTRAHLRIVEGKTHKHTLSHDTIRPSVILNNDSLKHLSPVVINDVHTSPVIMKNMSPYSSSTESAHDTAEPEASATSTSPRRRPSRIPLPGTSRPTTAISPTSVKQTRSPNRSLSRDSVRSVSSIPIARSPHSTLGTPRNASSPAPRLKRDSLTGRVRNHDSLSRVRENNSSSTPSHKSVSNKSRSPHLGGDNNKTIKPAWIENSQLTIRPDQSATIQTSLIRQYLNKQRVPPCLDTNKPLDTLFNNFNLQEDTQPQGLWDLTYHADCPDQIDSENITLNTQNHSISSIDYFDSINSAILDSSCFVGTSSHNKSGGGEDLAYCDSLQMSFIDSGQ